MRWWVMLVVVLMAVLFAGGYWFSSYRQNIPVQLIEKYLMAKNQRLMGFFYGGVDKEFLIARGVILSFSKDKKTFELDIQAKNPIKVKLTTTTKIDDKEGLDNLFLNSSMGDVIYVVFNPSKLFIAKRIYLQKTDVWRRAQLYAYD